MIQKALYFKSLLAISALAQDALQKVYYQGYGIEKLNGPSYFKIGRNQNVNNDKTNLDQIQNVNENGHEYNYCVLLRARFL